MDMTRMIARMKTLGITDHRSLLQADVERAGLGGPSDLSWYGQI
jgi:hypothetical protein